VDNTDLSKNFYHISQFDGFDHKNELDENKYLWVSDSACVWHLFNRAMMTLWVIPLSAIWEFWDEHTKAQTDVITHSHVHVHVLFSYVNTRRKHVGREDELFVVSIFILLWQCWHASLCVLFFTLWKVLLYFKLRAKTKRYTGHIGLVLAADYGKVMPPVCMCVSVWWTVCQS